MTKIKTTFMATGIGLAALAVYGGFATAWPKVSILVGGIGAACLAVGAFLPAKPPAPPA